MRNKITSLYIHIPFCSHICHYCDFTKLFYNEKFSEPYLKALFAELNFYKPNKLKTIYVGGGTPSCLSIIELEQLLKRLKPLLSDDYEFTFECNVESLNKEKLQLLFKYGVNRLSIGIQSTNDETLKLIGRHHSYLDAKNCIILAKSIGFSNINVDLIFGFPKKFKQNLLVDLGNVIKLNVEHISIYSLTVSKGTIFANQNIKPDDEDKSRADYDLILKTLRNNGYTRYEISNFAKNKHYSKHNLIYWKDKQYYGIGLGASGYINGIRYTNTKNLSAYLAHNFIDIKEKLTYEEQIEEFLLTNLRLAKGFKKCEFKKRFGEEFTILYKEKAHALIKDGLLKINKTNIFLTDEGLILLDYVLMKLI